MKPKRLVQEKRSLLAALVVLLTAGAFGGAKAAGQAVTLVPDATRYAGLGTNSRGYNSDFGPAATVELSTPTGINFDASGNLLVADRGNSCVRRIDTSSQHLVTTLAGLATSGAGDTCNSTLNTVPSPSQGLLNPYAVAADSANNIYIADTGHNCVRELTSGTTGVANLVTVAGTCGSAPLSSATPTPVSLQTDGSGNLYILTNDNGDGIYQVLRHNAGTANGTLCRVAGSASSSGVAQCPDVTAPPALRGANGIAFDGAGGFYIADTGNNCVRKLANGVFTVAAGTCGSATSILNAPTGLAFNLSGNMLISTSDNNQLLRYNQNTGALQTIAGNPNTTPGAYAATQDGAASTSVPLNQPFGMAEDSSNNLYLADSGNNILREFKTGNLFPQTTVGQTSPQQTLTYAINSTGTLTVAPGTDYAIVPGTDTCTGAHTAAAAGATPASCAVGVVFTPTAPGNRYSPLTITNTTSATRVVSGLQGIGVGPLGELFPGQANTFASGLVAVLDVSVDTAGNVYVLHAPTAATQEVVRYPAGGGAPTVIIPAGTLTTAVAMALDAAGNIYIANSTATAGSVEKFGADGSVNASYATNLGAVRAITVDGFGNLLAATGTTVVRIFSGGPMQVLAGGGSVTPAEGLTANTVALSTPSGVALAPSGTVFFSDSGAARVYSVDTTGALHIIAGTGATAGSDTTTTAGVSQPLLSPRALGVDPAGDLFIADNGANKVYVVFATSAAANNLRRILGVDGGTATNAGDGGVSTAAAVANPVSVTTSPTGVVYVGSAAGRVRSVTFPNATLNFGSVAVNSVTSEPQSLWSSGNALLLRTGDPVVTNTNFAYDSGDTTCGAAVQAGLLCDLYFTFSPTATGPQNGTATVADSAPSSPQTISLTGTVVPPLLTGFTATAEAETYGGPYTGTVNITTNGGTIPNGTVTFTINGSVTCTVTGNVIGAVTCTLPAGTLLPVQATPYPVVVTFTGNYPNQTANTTLTETPRPLSEIVTSLTKVYLATNPAFSGTPNGLLTGVGSDSFNVSYSFGATTITTTTAPGTYSADIVATITPNGSTNPNNYVITNTPGNFTVTKATLPGFGAAAETEIYGGVYTATASFTQPSGGATPTGSVVFRNGQTVLCTTSISTAASCTIAAGTQLPVGTYTISASYNGDGNYAGANSNTTLTVTPAPLAVAAANQTKAFGAAVPTLTGAVTGLVNGDTVGSTIIVTYATTVNTGTPIGTYPNSITATVSGSSAGNYTISNTPGSFVVTGTGTTAKLTSTAGTASAGTPITFTLKVTSTGTAVPSGTVVFTSDGATIGTSTLDGTGTATFTTTALSAGTHTVAGAYSGNADFAGSSSSVTEIITVPVGSYTVSFTPYTQLIRGPGQTTYTVVVTSTGGFSGSVALACSGLPVDATCTFGQTTLTVGANSLASTTVTTTTTSADAVVSYNRAVPVRPGVRPAGGSDWPGAFAISAAAAFPMQISGLGLLAAGVRRRKRMGRTQMRIVLLLLLAVGLLGFAGCGYPSGVFHTYPITVTATSVGGGPAPVSATAYLAVGLSQ